MLLKMISATFVSSHSIKCTNFKTSSGHWRPNQWKCEFCQVTAESSKSLDPYAKSFSPKTSSPCQEAQKSTLNIDNPDEELYQNQIDILKAVNAQREAENKKLRESNDLKAKQIMNLELNWRKPDNFLIVMTT